MAEIFQIGLSGQMFDDCSIWEHLQAAAEFGYKSVELRSTHVNPSTPEEELKKIRDFLKENDLRVSCLSCFVGNYGLLTENECETAFEIFKKYISLAVYFDCDMIRIWPAWQESGTASDEVWEKAAKWMRKSAEYAAVHKKKLVMEMHHGTLCDTAESSLRLLNMIGRDNVGLTLDPVNLYQVPADYTQEAIKKLGKHIFNVHIKDIVEMPTGSYPYAFEYTYYVRHIGRFTPVVPPSIKKERYYSHRRINHGGVDWAGVISGLREIGYNGYLVVESVSEGNKDMPAGRNLAKVCHDDAMAVQGLELPRVKEWKVTSPTVTGFHEVISPRHKDCRQVYIYRLNLETGQSYELESRELEMNAVLIHGECSIQSDAFNERMSKYDSFYIPGDSKVLIKALKDTVFYIGAARYEGIGNPFFRRYEKGLPLGNIHQIHGSGVSAREVFFTLNPEMPASRLICGITWGGQGAWTSWPPHQHEKYLEEVYCYFDMPSPGFGMHLSYYRPGEVDEIHAHIVKSGDMVLAPYGYHPTVASPGIRNTYFWVLAAHKPEHRRYDLAEPDENFS